MRQARLTSQPAGHAWGSAGLDEHSARFCAALILRIWIRTDPGSALVVLVCKVATRAKLG